MSNQIIVEPTFNFDFSKLMIGPPNSMSNGNCYFTRLFLDNRALYVQTPSCTSKNGFVIHNKKCYIDLLVESRDTLFIDWIERLETRCIDLLYDKVSIYMMHVS